MTKTVVTVDGDSIDGLLHKHLGAYSDATEEKFYQLNPSATSLPAVLSSGIKLTIPEPVKQNAKARINLWS